MVDPYKYSKAEFILQVLESSTLGWFIYLEGHGSLSSKTAISWKVLGPVQVTSSKYTNLYQGWPGIGTPGRYTGGIYPLGWAYQMQFTSREGVKEAIKFVVFKGKRFGDTELKPKIYDLDKGPSGSPEIKRIGAIEYMALVLEAQGD